MGGKRYSGFVHFTSVLIVYIDLNVDILLGCRYAASLYIYALLQLYTTVLYIFK